jgi:hypothetical protein
MNAPWLHWGLGIICGWCFRIWWEIWCQRRRFRRWSNKLEMR